MLKHFQLSASGLDKTALGDGDVPSGGVLYEVHHLVGGADDLGPGIASLLSEESRWVNAQRIEVAGGVAI